MKLSLVSAVVLWTVSVAVAPSPTDWLVTLVAYSKIQLQKEWEVYRYICLQSHMVL